MAAQSKGQKKTVERVMHEYKHGELKTRGRKVRSSKQAIAIALSESGSSRNQSPRENKARLRKTKRAERSGRTGRARAEGRNATRTRAELYAEARKRNVPGRSRMTKAQLERALRRR